MKVLVLGSGGREDALFCALRRSPKVKDLFIAPGNAAHSDGVVPLDINDTDELILWVKSCGIDLVVIGPERPVAMGLSDALRREGIQCFGVSQEASKLESSKAFAKDFMRAYQIPTARYGVFSDYEQALKYSHEQVYPLVVKVDGLASGKGVFICEHKNQAQQVLHTIMRERSFHDAGNTVVIEEYLQGEELSAFALLDGKTVLPFAYARDYKKRFDGDKGENTGGMGAFAPCPLSPQLQKQIETEVFQRSFQALHDKGIVYQGVLYAGLMVQKDEVKVLEFNVRFGDPEAQVILPLLNTDIIDVFEAVSVQQLDSLRLSWSDDVAVCVVLVSHGYPNEYTTGFPIWGLQEFARKKNVALYHAGTRRDNGHTLTHGGRVLSVVGRGKTLVEARDRAYEGVSCIHFENKAYRTDIATVP